MGGASRWYLRQALEALQKDLARHRSKLVLRRGVAAEEIARLAEETGAKTVHAIRHYEPWWRETEDRLAQSLDLCLHDGNYLLPPGTVTTGSGNPYKIYTPFKDASLACIHGFDILDEPSLASPDNWPDSDSLDDWALEPARPDWAGGLRDFWEAGTAAALDRFDTFLDVVSEYADDCNLPSVDGSSQMSPHLHFGEISPRQLWDEPP